MTSKIDRRNMIGFPAVRKLLSLSKSLYRIIGSTIIVVTVVAGQSECRCRNQGLPGFQLSQNVDICGYVKSPLPCLVALLVEYIYPAFFGVKLCQPGNGCFRPQSGYTIGMIFSEAYSCFRPRAAIRAV